MYKKGLEAFAGGDIDLVADTIKVLLVNAASYTPNLTTHQYHADVSGGAIVATSSALASKSVTNGTFDADDVVFTAVSGSQISYVILYKDTGSSATSPLICIFDTGTGLPVTPNGGDITVQWDSGTNKIFTL